MAEFMENLWGSIFTPGATPTSSSATNVTFGALQITLAALLAATYSIHFVILSVLCAGLWWSINWFATESQAAQAKEEEAERIRKAQGGTPRSKGSWKEKGEVGDSADDEGTETEVEDGKTSVVWEETQKDKEIRENVSQDFKKSGEATIGGGTSTGSKPPAGDARQRKTSGDMGSEISTDSEWEKVENDQ